MKGTILEKIIEQRRIRVEAAKRSFDASLVRPNPRPHCLRAALSDRTKPNIIAEFKRASPSKGIINDSLEPAAAAAAYRDGGAIAISVLTEEDFFQGSLNDLQAVRETVDLPILRKDFIIDEFQIYESAAVGADAILLIVAALEVEELKAFQSLADELGLDALVEVHEEEEMAIAIDIGSKLIGVNNRDLHTFEVSLETSSKLAQFASCDTVLIAESGIRTREDILQLADLGYRGFLIGETLMRSGDVQAMLNALLADSESEKVTT